MNKKNRITLILLLALTIIVSVVSNSSISGVVIVILGIASLKFIGVAFQFMELNQAHIFWKGLLIGYLVLFMGIVILII